MSNQNWWNKPIKSQTSTLSSQKPSPVLSPARTKKSSWWNTPIKSKTSTLSSQKPSPALYPPARAKKSSWWNTPIKSKTSPISPDISPDAPKSEHNKEAYQKYGTILIWSIVLIALIGGGYFCYKYIKLKKITNDKDSTKRMDNLVNSLESVLGTRWRGILCTFLILCMFTIFILYLLSKKDGSTITLSDRQFEVLEVTGIFIASVITIVVTGATIYMVYNHYKQKNSVSGQNNNFETKDTNQKQTFEVIGLAVGIILIISILIGYFIHHRKKIQQFHQKSAI